ncbi:MULTISPECIES: HIT family protein [Burkholderia]|jgi:histidine triad (HIT) family protein|uniref:HIT family protein n=2 Tax=Burkholderia gladioli TaxID=28095 RepID=A0A095Y6T3_BURGA|nr:MULTISPECIES: HIT family protein [Burkholderia]AEA64663.1 HIT family protein [Burkholderia gladioli BSR3]AJW94965.1 hit-like protein involved in cell-cycle regulation [Burkholderia gladioli]ASD84245.1 HIT family protein [Burkholderia gladioli pv. gladioli]ATF88398.1 HIT family protein [Burkholderia gladioli pv. gladioli]AWY51668.1 HIT family protein [Burkholderia gladioli pv. gladioli]
MAYDDKNIFAKILRGELPCTRVYESDSTIAFMDIMPQSPGHTLVVPKEAAEMLYELSDEAAAECIRVTKRIALAIREALRPDGLFIGQFNGAAAGQTVPHVHFHLIPRWATQPLGAHSRDVADPKELEAMAERIRAALK